MKTSKKLCKNGRLTLPKIVRAEAGLFAGNAVDIENNADGSITIKPSAPCCRFCGSVEHVLSVDNIIICSACAKKILTKVGVSNERKNDKSN